MQWFLCDQKFDFAQLTERDDQKVSKTPKLKKKKKKKETEEEAFTLCTCPNKKLLCNQLTSRWRKI